MAAGGFKIFTTGEVLTSADTNNFLMQGLLVFANAAARDAAITAPEEGQACYLKDTDAVLTYSGSTWVGFDDSNAIQNAIINAKGDLIAGSANDTPSILAAGGNGQTLVADSSTSTGLRYQVAKSVNHIINGGMDIFQRGTSFASGALQYTADRFQFLRGSAAVGGTLSRQNTSDTTNLPEIQFCSRIQRDSGNSSTEVLFFASSLESQETRQLQGRPVVLSFYARKGANYSAASNVFVAEITSGTGTDQNIFSGLTGQASVAASNKTLTTTWQRFTVSATVTSAATQLVVLFKYTPVGTAGAADFAEITGVQLELGTVPTPFQRSGGTLAGELAACQRYYFRQTATAAFSNLTGFGYEQSATAAQYSFFPVQTMRVKPSSVDFSAIKVSDYNSSFAITAFALSSNNADGSYFIVDATIASGGTAGRPAVIQANNNSAAFIGFSAEL